MWFYRCLTLRVPQRIFRGSQGAPADLQEHPNGRNFIFSIWDNADQRAPIKAVYAGHGTTTEPFGGEGTGLKSWNFKLPWETDVWYALAARAWPVGDDTYCGLWVRDGVSGKWRHLITMDVALSEYAFVGPLDAFLEDWSSTGANRRESHLRGAWRRKSGTTWEALTQASYSVNRNDLASGGRSFNYRNNWDGGKKKDVGGEFFYMTAGGSGTTPTTANPSGFAIPSVGTRPGYAALDLKSITSSWIGGNRLAVAWERDSVTLPQFKYVLEVFTNPGYAGAPALVLDRSAPDRSADTVDLDEAAPSGSYFGRLTVVDIFDDRMVFPAFSWSDGKLTTSVRATEGAERRRNPTAPPGIFIIVSEGGRAYSGTGFTADGKTRHRKSAAHPPGKIGIH